MSTKKELSATRKADRVKMAKAIVQHVAERGGLATANTEKNGEIRIRVHAPGGAYCTVHLDSNSSRPNCFILSWNIDHGIDRKFFRPAACFGSVNEFHQRKATCIAHGLAELLQSLGDVLDSCADGEAYDDEDDDTIFQNGLDILPMPPVKRRAAA